MGSSSDIGYRSEVRRCGDRQVEAVSGSAYSASRRSPEYPGKFTGGGGGSVWCFCDPESKRRKRVASYKVYSVEGKIKGSLRRGLRWVKAKCSELAHGHQ